MAKLVGVYHEEGSDSPGSNSRKSHCLARRQLPLTIESDLTMIMALDDACLACSGGIDSRADKSGFLKRYESLTKDELSVALMVNFDDLMGTLSGEVSCVGCRRSVEALLNKLYSSGDSALEPLVITDEGILSVGRDHLFSPQAVSNLFCGQLPRLRSAYTEAEKRNKKGGHNGRCAAHSLGLGTKKLMTFGHWLDTWECMEKECQEECVLVHFELLRATVDRYLKKHSFCSECTNMVNKAYNLLISGASYEVEEEKEDRELEPGEVVVEGEVRKHLFKGITACVTDQHVHVECNTEFVSRLIRLAEPELSGLRQERHAKTIEIAQKEVLTCIGICLYERFQRIQQRLKEGQQSCDLLFLVALKSLKQSFDVAFESKQGISDLEKLCQELDEEERKKQEKAQKKRDKKKKKKENLLLLHKEKIVTTTVKEDTTTTTTTTKKKVELNQGAEALSVISLACMLEQGDSCSAENRPDEEMSEEDEEYCGIPLEDIQQFRANISDVSQQREELRRNLRQRFDQLCVNGL